MKIYATDNTVRCFPNEIAEILKDELSYRGHTLYRAQSKTYELPQVIQLDIFNLIRKDAIYIGPKDALGAKLYGAYGPPLLRMYYSRGQEKPFWRIEEDGAKLTTRVRNEYKKLGFKIPSETISQIGNLVAMNVNPPLDYLITFTNTFDWEAGTFGDKESCFWGGRRDARISMALGQVYAMQVFTTDEEPLARAWLASSRPCVTLFNAYCKRNFSPYLTLSDMGRILESYLKCKPGAVYKKIHPLRNYTTSDGQIWINKSTGLTISNHTEIVCDISDMDLERMSVVECAYCATYHLPNRQRYCLTNSKPYSITSLTNVCDKCIKLHFLWCSRCGVVERHRPGHYSAYQAVSTATSTKETYFCTLAHCRAHYPCMESNMNDCPHCSLFIPPGEQTAPTVLPIDAIVTSEELAGTGALQIPRSDLIIDNPQTE